ncbi:MAG TPA: PQQ-dependent sugar dehydrogenase, partial [Anaerolineales bacterium]|nr:PQQ-dependent sugar dehydrogenase [Anaerolineales bacterium]
GELIDTWTLTQSPTGEALVPTEAAPPSTGESELPSNVVTFPNAAAFDWTPIANGYNSPILLTHTRDGSNRLFLVEQPGTIRIIGQETPFLDIRNRVGDEANEQGLLGLAFHPLYEENGYFYVNYTDNNGDTIIARYETSRSDPNQADDGSEIILLRIRQPFGNHNGGHLAFGPDGYLYIATGDGGSAGDPEGNAQNSFTLLGKLLRIDVNTSPYTSPPDNPFLTGDGLHENWAYGLRNPWRFSFDRLTGDLYIGDVGQNAWEEINFLATGTPGGVNLGWDYFEGTHAYEGSAPPGLNLMAPVWEYPHAGSTCSVTGGYVYRGSALPEWFGVYLYGDYCSGQVWGLLRDANGVWQNTLLFETGVLITSFGEDEAGEVYLVARQGDIYKLVRR